jgi:geranylgeranyl diphosphate synthase type I
VIDTVPASLERARRIVRPVIQERLERLSPELRRVAAYHFGFTDADGRRSAVDGGKAIRPTLALLSAEAAGVAIEVGIPGAVAVELVHNFSLLHDDVMDQDRERRHRETAWALFGVGQAIVAGDALLALAHRVLLEDPTPERVGADASLTEATARMIQGQSQDLAFESRAGVSLEECVEMCANKTGALLAAAASIGAILAGAPERAVRGLAAFGLHLGQAFQAIDDVLGIWGRPDVTGKPAANDLRQHKKTLPVVAAIATRSPQGARLEALLAKGNIGESEVAEAVGLIETAGGRAWAMDEADRQLQEALTALDGAAVAPGPKEQLIEVARFVTTRDF